MPQFTAILTFDAADLAAAEATIGGWTLSAGVVIYQLQSSMPQMSDALSQLEVGADGKTASGRKVGQQV